MKIKSVYDYCAPWEVLFDVVLHHQEQLIVHIGELVMVDRSWRSRAKRLFRMNNDGSLPKVNYLYLGGELLTRCNPDLLPPFLIGSAFNDMPTKKMELMFPLLLQFQVDFIKQMDIVSGQYYSVNLESPDGSWDAVCNILSTCEGVPINVELKENAQLSPHAMKQLATVCAKTGIRIYIDDLCTFCHRIPDQQDYIIMLIEVLHPYIKLVKVDYDVMKKIRKDWMSFKLVRNNLEAFAWFWFNVTGNKMLPYVVFESMPVEEMYWLDQLEMLAHQYPMSCYQRG
jgi:hypothetical protein